MQLKSAIALLASIIHASVASDHSLDACPKNGSADNVCVYSAPLCHPGICEAPESVNSTIEVAVMSVIAKKADYKTAPNVWYIRGASGYDVEDPLPPMVALYMALNQEVNMYTMDYRGVGSGTTLTCDGDQTVVAGTVELEQVPECAQSLADRYGDLAAFSTTSAATDLATFITNYGNGASTTVYGAGFGSLVVERLMHLDPPDVTGYVMDAIATTSGAPPGKFSYVSASDTDFGEVGDAFLELCVKDSKCNAHFKKKGLKATLEHLYKKLDAKPNSTCAKLVKTARKNDNPPSDELRLVLGSLLSIKHTQPLIAPLIYRLHRCAPNDVDVLTHLFKSSQGSEDTPEFLLPMLVSFSELWESPSPSLATLKARFENATMGSAVYEQMELYCAFSKEKSAACENLKVGNYKGDGIIYERDEYWNKAATIPKKASVLLLSSEMDPLAPTKYAEALLEALDGENKELVTFKYKMDNSLVDTTTMETLCGTTILASYVRGKGDLTKLDKACLDDERLDWTIQPVVQSELWNTKDPYNGEYDPSLAAQSSSGSSE